MFTPTQIDDLRFVRDCLRANGDRGSESLVQWLIGTCPKLKTLLRQSPQAPRLFLPQAFELILRAADKPGKDREQIRGYGRLLAAMDVNPAHINAGIHQVSCILSEQLGQAYTKRVRESCAIAVASALAWLHDGMVEARREARVQETV